MKPEQINKALAGGSSTLLVAVLTAFTGGTPAEKWAIVALGALLVATHVWSASNTPATDTAVPVPPVAAAPVIYDPAITPTIRPAAGTLDADGP